jgi:hypothetical protein
VAVAITHLGDLKGDVAVPCVVIRVTDVIVEDIVTVVVAVGIAGKTVKLAHAVS